MTAAPGGSPRRSLTVCEYSALVRRPKAVDNGSMYALGLAAPSAPDPPPDTEASGVPSGGAPEPGLGTGLPVLAPLDGAPTCAAPTGPEDPTVPVHATARHNGAAVRAQRPIVDRLVIPAMPRSAREGRSVKQYVRHLGLMPAPVELFTAASRPSRAHDTGVAFGTSPAQWRKPAGRREHVKASRGQASSLTAWTLLRRGSHEKS